MGCLSVLVLVASLLAVQVRLVTGCSIKGEVQCNEMFPFLQNVNNFLPLLSWRLLTRKYWFCWFLWWESYDSLSFISFQLDIRNLMGQGKVPSQYITIGDKSQHPEQYNIISFTNCHDNDVEERSSLLLSLFIHTLFGKRPNFVFEAKLFARTAKHRKILTFFGNSDKISRQLTWGRKPGQRGLEEVQVMIHIWLTWLVPSALNSGIHSQKYMMCVFLVQATVLHLSHSAALKRTDVFQSR